MEKFDGYHSEAYVLCWRTFYGKQTWERVYSETILAARVQQLEANGLEILIFNERDAVNVSDL